MDQNDRSHLHPRSLTKSEKNYAQIQKEALEKVWVVKKFITFLYGRKFTLLIDNAPFTTIFNPYKSLLVTILHADFNAMQYFLSEFII